MKNFPGKASSVKDTESSVEDILYRIPFWQQVSFFSPNDKGLFIERQALVIFEPSIQEARAEYLILHPSGEIKKHAAHYVLENGKLVYRPSWEESYRVKLEDYLEIIERKVGLIATIEF